MEGLDSQKICIMPAHVEVYDRVQRFILSRATNGPPSTFQPSKGLPFQRWYHFKEAFSPEIVVEIASRLQFAPQSCLDPFGGSGTTALTCQFLGIRPSTIEVNPFLADVIEAKLSSYEATELLDCLDHVANKRGSLRRRRLTRSVSGPKTLIEPGVGDNWVFDTEVAKEIFLLRDAIDTLPPDKASFARLFRVLLGSYLVEYSNCYVNGKGRRYRRNWRERRADAKLIYPTFCEVAEEAARDIRLHKLRGTGEYSLFRGDARHLVQSVGPIDFAVFSPPYPNSFDYTDIYNLELWMLGYLSSWDENQSLRRSTLRSHVQIRHPDAVASLHENSRTLRNLLRTLELDSSSLWNRRIPKMILGYFEDLIGVITQIKMNLTRGGVIALVVGDSAYNGNRLNVGRVLRELLSSRGITVEVEPLRKMRMSAQQGGKLGLYEHLVIVHSET